MKALKQSVYGNFDFAHFVRIQTATDALLVYSTATLMLVACTTAVLYSIFIGITASIIQYIISRAHESLIVHQQRFTLDWITTAFGRHSICEIIWNFVSPN